MIPSFKSRRLSSQGFLLCALFFASTAFVPEAVKQKWVDTQFTMEDAIKNIEDCSERGKNSDERTELFYSVKFIDRFANQFYDTHEKRQALLDRANGSWELRLAANSDRDEDFFPHPDFRSFAMAFSTIEDEYVGKGIATVDKGFCFVALGGPSYRKVDRRQVFMNYEDYFINGRQVPGWDLSYYIRGSRRDQSGERDKPKLAFTVICCTDKVMALRGSKTGGLAIFKRVDEDMTHVAFGA